MKNLSINTTDTLKLWLFCVCLLPFAGLLLRAVLGALGPDPVADITHTTGIWSLRLLLAMLAVTPLKKLTGWSWLMRLRRTLALYAFFYASLHCLAYLLFEQSFEGAEILKDITKRPYISAGFLSFTLMVPLAATSTNAMMKRLGGHRWRQLHRLSYLIGISAVLHYFWLVKRDINLPALYILILAVLLCARLLGRQRKQQFPPSAKPMRA